MLDVGEPAQQYGNRSHQAECIPLGRYPAYGSDMDPEGQNKSAEFCNASIRRGFMRNVESSGAEIENVVCAVN